VNRVLSAILKNEIVLSITTDNDIAFTKWKLIEKQLNTYLFFTDPFSSWQKGLVENMNRWIRQFLPKRTDFKKVSFRYLNHIQVWLNNQPREVLNFKTSEEVFQLLKNNVRICSPIAKLPGRIY
jgi:IS30 family transposase